MKHGSTTSLQSQIGSQLIGQQQVKAVQSDQWSQHQEILPSVFWDAQGSSITLRKEEPSIANII